MKVQTFIGKSNVDGLHLMDEHINNWMDEYNITPIHVTQTSGCERFHGGNEEPIIVTSIFYDNKA